MTKKKQNTPYGLKASRARYHLINRKSTDRKRAFHELKELLVFSDLCHSMDYLERNLPSERNELIYGNPLPNEYASLGNLKEAPYLGENIHAELNQNLIGVRKYRHEINLFLTYKELYEENLLTGNYSQAEQYLDKIEKDVCYSLWTLENRFVLFELSGKASENKKFLSSFNEENKAKGITKSLAHYLSLRAEHSLSVNRYFNDLEIALSNLQNNNTKEAFRNYYRFKLTFLSHIDFSNYAAILALDFRHSIIDRYLNLTRVMTSLLAVSSYLQKDDQRHLDIKRYLRNRINYLIRKVNDPILFKLKLFSGDSIFPAFDIKQSQIELRTLDKYTTGLYAEAEKGLIELLKKKPNQFDLYLLYVKTLIYQKKDFTSIGNPKSVQNEILQALYKSTSVQGNPDQARLNLLRIANNLSSSTISYGITDYVFHENEGSNERKLLAKFSYNLANPTIHEIFTTDEEKEEFLGMLASRFPDSITIQFFQEKLKGVDSLIKYEQKIPEGQYKIEMAKKLQEKKNFIAASKEWEFLIQNYRDTTPIYETAIINLFKCYLILDKPDDCINLFVESFFQNNYIIEKIETKELLKKISSNRFRNVSRLINLPIFYTIVNADDVEAHIAYELFNQSRGVEKPSEILDQFNEFDENKMLYFLEFCCSPKILMHSTFIENSKERLEERLVISNYLKSKNPNNKNIEDEIKSIQNILVIQQGLIDLDESKIYVNEQGIIDEELQDFEAIYERFRIISGIAGDNKLLYLKGGELTTYTSNEDTEVEKVEYSGNPVFEIYSELFDAIKDKFLNSQYGIVAYLSTRIRHGVLIGELRPIFETHNLITLKEGSTSNYRRNYTWDLVYSAYSNEDKEQLQILLADFSSKVDGLIFDLIKKHLQVYKAEINDEGWFNYDFDPNELWYHSVIATVSSGSFEDFVNQIFMVLWNRTDENLENIRHRIENEILDKFNSFFNELEINLIHQFGQDANQQLVKSIKDCSTEMQTVMQKISRWFRRSEIKASDFKLSEVVNIIAEYTNKSSPYKSLRIETASQSDPSLKGEYKTHFADLIRIFLENIIKHSKEDAANIPCKIMTSIEGQSILQIQISNFITNEESIEALENLWKGNKLDFDKLLNEGKSGYHKAYKIITYDLKNGINDCLTTRISEEKDWFFVNLSIEAKDILA
ncbi:hypothetical protein [Echinicola sp. 20G]|uniref:hypothetical protein n=1 Tax=Echinicola sp. 20G TaxID=2781961 RepID=UPI001910C612|nr:hypothetical protein [Echinicola sp. 20G]